MSETVVVAIVTFIFGSAGTAMLNTWLNRRRDAVGVRKTDAEAGAIEAATRQSEVVYYQQLVDKTIKQMTVLEAKVEELKKYIGDIQTKYEHRVGELHTKIDNLVLELGRANKNLDIANETISELRQEVKEGNIIIAGLKEEITQLLVDKAEKKEG